VEQSAAVPLSECIVQTKPLQQQQQNKLQTCVFSQNQIQLFKFSTCLLLLQVPAVSMLLQQGPILVLQIVIITIIIIIIIIITAGCSFNAINIFIQNTNRTR